jgi:hypothetical protein
MSTYIACLLETGHSLSRILTTIQSRFAYNQLPATINGQIDAVYAYVLDDVLDCGSHLVNGKRYSGESGMLEEVVGEERREIAGHCGNDNR